MKCLKCDLPAVLKKAQLCKYHYAKQWRERDNRYINWVSMINRCLRPYNDSYAYYGGRGITICERWLDKKNGFKNFCEDMGEKPDGFTIDRIDHDGNYEPSNCRWASRRDQNMNKSNNNEVIGVRYDDAQNGKKKWRAYLRVGETYLASYSSTREEAIEKRKQYERDYVKV